MGSASKGLTWELESPPDDILVVVRAVEPVIADMVRRFPWVEAGTYYVSEKGSDATSLHNVERDELDNVLRQLRDVGTIAVDYESTVNSVVVEKKPRYRMNLWVSSFIRGIRVELQVSGPTSEALGLSEEARNRITNEIERQEKSRWTAPPLGPANGGQPANGSDIVAPAAQAATPSNAADPSGGSRGSRWSRLWATLNHQVLGGLIVGVIILALTIYMSRHDAEPLSQDPATTTTTAATTSTTVMTTPTTTSATVLPPPPPPTVPTTVTPPLPTVKTTKPVASRTCVAWGFSYPPVCLKWSYE